MESRRRDGLLALVAALALVGVAAWRDKRADLVAPLPLALGAAGALAAELVMARYPRRTAALWANPSVQAISTVGVVGLGLAATFLAPWLLGALFGGLLAYFVLLALVLTGVVPGPESWFDR